MNLPDYRTSPDTMSKAILIVDDEPHMCLLMKHTLKKHGYGFLVGHNGQEAVDLARQQSPALIVMDVNMPGTSGLEALRKLKEIPSTSRIPVIILTGCGDIGTRDRSETQGADLFLTKPFSPYELQTQVARLIAEQDNNEPVLAP